MRKTIAMMMSLMFLGFTTNAQDKDPKAKQILDEVGKKIKSYTSFYVEFSATLKASATATPETQKGNATIKGEKYIINMGDQRILSDGKMVWTILLGGENEVYENPVEDSEDDFSNPSKMFTIWEKDFKYKYVKEETIAGVVVHEIHLFPMNTTKSKFHTIIVKVDKVKSELHTVILKGKDGEVLTYQLTKFTANPAVTDADFKFDKAKYPGYKVIR
jgi:outer membrane lipoprotein-sorting protein